MESKKQKNDSLNNANEEKEISVRKKIFGKLFVVMIISLIIYEYYIFCIEIKFKHLLTSRNINFELFSLLIFHILLFLMIWSLLITMNTHPGEIPLYWVFLR